MQSEYFSTSKNGVTAKSDRVGPFILGKSLGRGNTGVVRLGKHRETGLVVAIKIIKKSFFKQRCIAMGETQEGNRSIEINGPSQYPQTL